jgi:hypothetical protein
MNPFDFIKSGYEIIWLKDKLAGIGEAVKQGFTHTNPAMTNFPSDTAEDLGSPDSAIKETK